MVDDRRRGQTDERILYVVVGALVGGGVFLRLGTWLQHLDVRENASLAEQWLYGNRSILGGLVGAWLGVHLVKRLVGYRSRTGDLFAPAVALGIAVGRVGCLLTELPGTPTGSSYGISLDAAAGTRLGAEPGVALHPSFLYEIVFHAVAFAVLWFYLRHRLTAPAERLTLYLAGYGLFRFLVEFVPSAPASVRRAWDSACERALVNGRAPRYGRQIEPRRAPARRGPSAIQALLKLPWAVEA